MLGKRDFEHMYNVGVIQKGREYFLNFAQALFSSQNTDTIRHQKAFASIVALIARK